VGSKNRRKGVCRRRLGRVSASSSPLDDGEEAREKRVAPQKEGKKIAARCSYLGGMKRRKIGRLDAVACGGVISASSAKRTKIFGKESDRSAMDFLDRSEGTHLVF